MNLNDPSTSECLRILLEDQSRRLSVVAQRISVLCGDISRATQPSEWRGLTRVAHDLVAQQLLSKLALAYVDVDDAAHHSARAVSTLGSRVG